MKSTITSEVVTITPKLASEMLCHNHSNRPPRETNIERFANMMKRGEWQVTHQGVAFDTIGRLVDGQHRLMAIVRSGITVDMMVTRGLSPEVFAVLDLGAKRVAADILKCPASVAELTNFAARIVTGDSTPSPATLQTMFEAVGHHAMQIYEHCAATAVFFSSSAMRLALMVRLIQGEDPQFALGLYAALVKGDTDNLTASGKQLLKLRLHNKVSATDKYTTMAYGLYVFDKRRADSTKLRPMEPQAATEVVRAVLRPLYEAKLAV